MTVFHTQKKSEKEQTGALRYALWVVLLELRTAAESKDTLW